MALLEELPQPTHSARNVSDVVSVVIEAMPLLGGPLGRVYEIALVKRTEKNLRLIVDRVKENGIDILNDDQISFLIPSTFRFAEQIKLGDYDHNLEIIRKIIVDGVVAGSKDSGKVGRHARQLEYLSEFEIRVFAEIARLYLEGHLDESIPASTIEDQCRHFSNEDSQKFQNALSVLSSRSILVSEVEVIGRFADVAYRLSPDGISIVSSAMKS
jgi:hypothetical protein